ncbi:MAG: serine hydroxymethyltransferase [Armatimonadota bacterium]|nr:serine hydroxymethyltransferase [Armatimonadota bacterium]MDR7422902.1 serine hydroxymethyltransferase [Armatimonadota bacterium]MDR7452914.1 serine hydroxymethyltransferase [Armatimonadota bacterium]MDR7455661.1 serine hydroxymethyltransferase [Armatimonadota bacterium]MDR7497382.1 serine hydroxymethyltransferase [Armatimonadota bacterium]
MALAASDPELYAMLERERARQRDGVELIPSENYVSAAVLEAMGTVFTNKYSEGYPGRRYYGGNEVIDEVERLAQARARALFGVPHANVQPYSGSPANLAVYLATCQPGDVIMGQNLPDGGHLTHGWKVSATGIYYKSVPYHVRPDGYIDVDEVRALARAHRPRLIWCGATAYVREFPFAHFAEIADEVGAYFAADIAHIAGLVVGGAHASPVPHAHVVTTTTHKTLRGPRGAMILVTERGLARDPELAEKVDRAIFPGLQGGPHDHTTAAIAVALGEAARPEFATYARQVVANAKALGAALVEQGFTLVTGGTDNHMLLVDLTPGGPGRGTFVQEALDAVGITVNKNTIPGEPVSAFYPSGVRLGTPAATTRGMRESEMRQLAAWMRRVHDEITPYRLPEEREARNQVLREFREAIRQNRALEMMRAEVRELCRRFPVPGIG